MKLLKLSLMLLVVNFYACTEEEEMKMCDYERVYPEIPEVNFTVNGTDYVQNVGTTTFRNEQNPPELSMVYTINASSANKANIDLRFTHARFLNDENCAAAYEHRIFLNLNVDQNANESKTYPVTLNSSVPDAASGSYVLEKNPPQLPSGSNNSITITRFVPENRLEGNFSIVFGGSTQTSGSFSLDLTKEY